MRDSKICLFCDRVFERSGQVDHVWKRKKTCDKQCSFYLSRQRWRKRRAEKIVTERLADCEAKYCEECGRSFSVEDMEFSDGIIRPHLFKQRKYCSDSCRDAGRHRPYYARISAEANAGLPTSKICLHCDEEFERTTEHASAWKQKKFCSKRCRKLYHQWWKYVTVQPNYDAYCELARHMVYEEELSCTECGEADKSKLEVDHILARGLGGSDERENLQVLCKDHHYVKSAIDRSLMRIAA